MRLMQGVGRLPTRDVARSSRRFAALFVALAGVLILCSISCTKGNAAQNVAAANEASAAEKPVRLMLAGDVHYLSQKLTDGGAMIQTVLDNGDGKYIRRIEEIVDSFVDEVIREKPDALVLSGDLTFNGARQSHEDLAAKLLRVQNAGIAVLLIPGNHDIENPYAAKFSGASYELVPSVSASEFAEIYHNFLSDDSRDKNSAATIISRDKNSLSYVARLRSDFSIVMLDTNSSEVGFVSKQTLAWLDAELKRAAKNGGRVVAVSHQTLLSHNPLFSFGFQIENADELLALYKECGVLCNLSGHMHIQHVVRGEVTEAVTSALSVSPHHYAEISFDGNMLLYKTKTLDVPQVPDFAELSRAYFEDNSRRKLMERLNDSALDENAKRRVVELFVKINTAYFSGDEIDKNAISEALSVLENAPNSFMRFYLQSISLDEAQENQELVVHVR